MCDAGNYLGIAIVIDCYFDWLIIRLVDLSMMHFSQYVFCSISSMVSVNV